LEFRRVLFGSGWFTMKFVWPPLTKAIDERRQKIAAGLADAERGKADLAQAQARVSLLEASAKAENQSRLADAEKQATALIEAARRSEEHTSELQSRENLVCRLLLEKKKKQ